MRAGRGRRAAAGVVIAVVATITTAGIGIGPAEADECADDQGVPRIIEGHDVSIRSEADGRYLEDDPGIFLFWGAFSLMVGDPISETVGPRIETTDWSDQTTWTIHQRTDGGHVWIVNRDRWTLLSAAPDGRVTGDYQPNCGSSWLIEERDDGTVRIVNATTGHYLRARGSAHGHAVDAVPNGDDPTTGWVLVDPIG